MRFTLHWRGEPLIAFDLTAQSPDDDEPDASLEPPMGLSASGGGSFDMAEPMEPDTTVFGFGRLTDHARRGHTGVHQL